MPRKNPPTGTDADLNLATMLPLFTDEAKAREFIENKRWPNGPVCPHCECVDVYKLTAKPESKNPVRPGVYKCKACRKQFTVRIGTIFEESLLPLSKWLMAIHLMTSSKKGISSHQIARELGITVKSAWFLTHRIREAMKKEPMAGMLSGTVEVDETYVGGKPRHPGTSKRGRGTKKTPVIALVERDGDICVGPIGSVDGATLKGEVKRLVTDDSVIMTDELASYTGLKNDFAGHETVNHSAKQYARVTENGEVAHTNTAESFFALLKRGHYGIFHKISKKHMHRYCSEFGFRWDHRNVSDGERMVAAIEQVKGKRLMYKLPKGDGLAD
jgi:transposase-like protein